MSLNINRLVQNQITSKSSPARKVIVLYGPRQVGKTTMVKNIIDNHDQSATYINGDILRNRTVLSSGDMEQLTLLIGNHKLVVIDEAQRIPDIGINLKILYDSFPDVQFIITGSSTLDLASGISEALTGRTRTYRLYPISFHELAQMSSPYDVDGQLDTLLVYGSYPEQLGYANVDDRADYLRELTSAYLYKDVLEMETIKHSDTLVKLLKLLAFQVGNEVSTHELSRSLGINRVTVDRYIDLLEKSFVLYRLSGYSRNLRKEVTKKDKIYFYDLGVRNAMIDNFKPLAYRNDIGALWENFIIMERIKHQAYSRIHTNKYYWRTYTGAELDYVEEKNLDLAGFEFKYSTKKVSKAPKTWMTAYPGSGFQCITRKNYIPFILTLNK